MPTTANLNDYHSTPDYLRSIASVFEGTLKTHVEQHCSKEVLIDFNNGILPTDNPQISVDALIPRGALVDLILGLREAADQIDENPDSMFVVVTD